MNSIYAIVTHHDCGKHSTDEAADAWKLNDVCAIGWAEYGNLKRTKRKLNKEIQDFLGMKKGDLVLAYTKHNRIAFAGEVKDGVYAHTKKNEVGRDEDVDGFGYPNQYKMKWWDEPYDFSRKDLPDYLWKQMGITGRTVTRLELERYGLTFEQAVAIVRTNARSGSETSINEDTVKLGIRKYLGKHLSRLEDGLRVVRVEKAIGPHHRPDFEAKDRRGNSVLIECKGTATPDDVDQIVGYGRERRASRLMLVAFRISDKCKHKAKSNRRLELYECDLVFSKVGRV